MPIQIKLDMKTLIDPGPVNRAYQDAERKVLTEAARRGRVLARSAMRRRKRASRPGEAPSVRKGQLKRFLVYAYEPGKHVSLFGPRKLSGAVQDTPEALEKGLAVTRRVGRKRIAKRIKIDKRPAMVPALDVVRPDLPAMWRGAVR